MVDPILLVPLAFGAGAATSLVGFGSGIVIAPVLAFLGLSPAQVASGSIFGTLGNLGGATLARAARRKMKYSLGLKIGLVSVPGSVAGAFLDNFVEPDLFNVLLGAVLVLSALMLLKGRASGGGLSARGAAMAMVPAGVSAGMVSSFFGIGGGVVVVPFMLFCMGMRMKEVAVVSQPALAITALAGVLAHWHLGHADVPDALLLLAGAFAGGLLGDWLSRRLGERQMRLILSLLIFGAAARLLWAAAEDAYRTGLPVLAARLGM